MTKPASPLRATRLTFALALAVVTLLLVAGVAELAVRMLAGRGQDFALEMWRYAQLAKRRSALPGVGHEHVPGVKARLMGVDVSINSLGMRDGERTQRPATGTTRVLMLGDSLTFGWGVPQSETTSAQLERALAGRPAPDGTPTRWEVLNAGVGNTNTTMQVAWFEQAGRALGATVVVLNTFINDAEPPPDYSRPATPSAALVFFRGRFDALSRSAGAAADWRTYYASLYAPDAPGWIAERAALSKFGALCKQDGLRCFVTSQPELHVLEPYPFTDVDARVAEAVKDAGLPFIDLRPSLAGLAPRSLWVTADDAHPNAVACGRFAAALAPVVAPGAP